MRYCFIINPNSRSQRGRAIWEEVQKELEKSQIKYEIYLTERRKNATAIAALSLMSWHAPLQSCPDDFCKASSP